MAYRAMVRACVCASLLGALAPRLHAEEPTTPSQAPLNAERRLPMTLPTRADQSPVSAPWPSALAWLGIAGAAGGLWWWLRAGARSIGRRSMAGGQGVVRLSSQALTPHASVHAVRWNGEDYLLACTSQEVTLVARRPVTAAEDA